MTINQSADLMQRWLSGNKRSQSPNPPRTRRLRRSSSPKFPIPKLRLPITTSDQHTFEIVISHGSIVHFAHSEGGIVNAANEGCLGGGGVDGAISKAGGINLHRDRFALPIVKSFKVRKTYHPRSVNDEEHDSDESEEDIRCPTGDAKLTGPGSYGSLQVPYVIHAVGPNYFSYPRIEDADALLRSAYTNSLERAKDAKLKCVAFSLLSAGIFRGSRSQEHVLGIGLDAINDFGGYKELEEVHLCAFSNKELDILKDLVRGVVGVENEDS